MQTFYGPFKINRAPHGAVVHNLRNTAVEHNFFFVWMIKKIILTKISGGEEPYRHPFCGALECKYILLKKIKFQWLLNKF